jgi:hypothetical protein
LFISANVELFNPAAFELCEHSAMEDYQKKLGSLADRIRNETPQTPIQQVQPVKPTPLSQDQEDARFNNWIPKALKRKIKAYGVQHDLSQKEITIRALEKFLMDNGQR